MLRVCVVFIIIFVCTIFALVKLSNFVSIRQKFLHQKVIKQFLYLYCLIRILVDVLFVADLFGNGWLINESFGFCPY